MIDTVIRPPAADAWRRIDPHRDDPNRPPFPNALPSAVETSPLAHALLEAGRANASRIAVLDEHRALDFTVLFALASSFAASARALAPEGGGIAVLSRD